MALGFMGCSFCTSIVPYSIWYATFGLGEGAGYTVAILLLWEYYPENKGKYAGIYMFFYGLGGFFFSLLTTILVNPNDMGKTIKVESKDG